MLGTPKGFCPRCKLHEKLPNHGYCHACYNEYHRERYRRRRVESLLGDADKAALVVFNARRRDADKVQPLPGVLWFLASECKDDSHTHLDPWVVKEHPEYMLPEGALAIYLARKDQWGTPSDPTRMLNRSNAD
jgi:hypothetical protein